jgi:hypothetical protein
MGDRGNIVIRSRSNGEVWLYWQNTIRLRYAGSDYIAAGGGAP